MKKTGLKIILGGMIILPLVLIILPSTYFDHGQSICLSKVMLNKECPGCGITRAIQHLIHFDYSKAYHFNKLSFIVFPILSFFWVKEFIRLWKKHKDLQ